MSSGCEQPAFLRIHVCSPMPRHAPPLTDTGMGSATGFGTGGAAGFEEALQQGHAAHDASQRCLTLVFAGSGVEILRE